MKGLLLKGEQKKSIYSYDFEEVEIESLEDMQMRIGGHLEGLYLNGMNDYYAIGYVNEDGKTKNIPESIIVVNKNGDVVDTIAGNILFLGLDSKGNDIPLSEEAISYIKGMFDRVLLFYEKDGKTVDFINGYKFIVDY